MKLSFRRIAVPAALFLMHNTVAAAAPAPSQDPKAASGAVTDHVIVISVDGLRPDAIAHYKPRTLTRLVNEGAYSLDARTVLPAKTLPSHTSMLSGVTPAVHSVTWNDDRETDTGYVNVETIFEIAKRSGFRTAAFMSKSKLKYLVKPGTLDHAFAPTGFAVLSAGETVEAALRYMRFEKPNVMFVHIAEPDFAGHAMGWMSFAYGWGVKRADAGIQQIINAAEKSYGKGGYTIIITADHGGHGRDHGDESDVDSEIPWISWGAGVQKGRITVPVNTMDTAATVLWLLGLHEPLAWQGRAVASAYNSSANVAVAARLRLR